jgi:hypothetical protein
MVPRQAYPSLNRVTLVLQNAKLHTARSIEHRFDQDPSKRSKIVNRVDCLLLLLLRDLREYRQGQDPALLLLETAIGGEK